MSFKELGRENGADIKVSFELFPPNSDAAEASLLQTASRLAALQPDFISVTYGAGGSTRERTLRTVTQIALETSSPVAAHMTCVDASRDEVDSIVSEFADNGITRFVALRGDPAAGVGERYTPFDGGYGYAAELVAALRTMGDFDISVAAYPETHPESPSIEADIENLKRKIDAGANRAITQFFFDNDDFERYMERVRAAGIQVPVIPGILPIHHFGKVANFAGKCGTSIPGWLEKRFEGLDEAPDTRALVSAAVAAEQVSDLAARGVTDFHFYTMNKAELSIAICRLLGIHENGGNKPMAA